MELSQKAETGLWMLRVKSALLRTVVIELELNVHWECTHFERNLQRILRWRLQNKKNFKLYLFPKYIYPSSRNAGLNDFASQKFNLCLYFSWVWMNYAFIVFSSCFLKAFMVLASMASVVVDFHTWITYLEYWYPFMLSRLTGWMVCRTPVLLLHWLNSGQCVAFHAWLLPSPVRVSQCSISMKSYKQSRYQLLYYNHCLER